MLNRRLFAGASGTLSAALAVLRPGRKAEAAKPKSFDVEPRGTQGRLERMPNLDTDSRVDFTTGLRRYRTDVLESAARARFNEILQANGLDPKANIPHANFAALVEDDVVIGLEGRVRIDSQRMAHRLFKQAFEREQDRYIAELEAYDKAGPGTLELNPGLVMPDYTRHEIHMQPGGYVGNAFAGAIYHYGTNAFYEAGKIMNYQDEHHAQLASQVPAPADGKMMRILDMGCGIGQLSIALKERHPKAEIWGIDVGAPMVRYGHMRAVDLNVEVHFAQRLAEDSKFPDGHFDVVASYILHHEVPAEASRKIMAEAFRVLRPGGVYFPIDFYTGNRQMPSTAYGNFQEWKDHRWNNEIWRIEYRQMDFPGALKAAGFAVNQDGPAAWYNKANIIGVKPA
ncbi:MAG: class I SAM-dependent methyltransferase [Alphaproteobacteria bacterium]|nr:class I SAM-dependent methyltransferase [Alphaproteobacteria bacterium]